MKLGYEDKHILITGGTGFIGSHLVKELVKRNARVFLLEDLSSNFWRLKGYENNTYIKYSKSWKYDDLRYLLDEIKPDIAFHLRALLQRNREEKSPEKLFKFNFEETQNLISAMEVSDVKIFIHVGTIAEYGNNMNALSENDVPEPNSFYGQSKLASSLWLHELIKDKGFPAAILRLSVVYGAYQNPHDYLIPNIIKNCLIGKDVVIPSSGTQKRDPLYIADAIEGLLLAGLQEKATGEIINLGLGKAITVLEIANIINEKLGSPITINTSEKKDISEKTQDRWHDISKAKEILSWIPSTSISDGLVETLNWYNVNRKILGVN